MSLVTPWGLLGLLGIPIIIIIYLLKSKYVSKPVSSTFIWKRSLKYVKNRLPLTFVFSLLLVLQILTVIVASFAMSRPKAPPLVTKDTIIILDSSASMMTVNDEGKTRFDLAIEQIKSKAESASENHGFTLITAGIEANKICERYKDKVEIVTAMEKITCDYGEPDIADAIKLSDSVRKKNPEAELYFYTDKEYIDKSGIEVVNFAKETDWNIAITNLTDVSMGGQFYFNATVNNYGPAVENIKINIYLNEGESPITTQTCSFEANSKTVITFAPKASFAASDAQFVQIGKIKEYDKVRVEFSGVSDGLSYDNTRTLYSKANKRFKILLVSEYIQMIENGDGTKEADGKVTTSVLMVLRLIGYNLSVKTDIKNDISLVNDGKGVEGYDLYIFDGGTYTKNGETHKVMPDVLPSDGAVWFINPESNPPVVVDGEDAITLNTAPTEAPKKEDGPGYDAFSMIKVHDTGTVTYKTLTNKIQANNLSVGKYYPINGYNDACFEEIFSCNGDAVLIAGKVNNVRIICWSLDINDTNIAINRDFPLLINNMVQFSLPESISERSFDVGDEVQFNVPVGAETLSFKLGENVLNVMDAKDTVFNLKNYGFYSIDVEYAGKEAQTYVLPTNIPLVESDIVSMGEFIEAESVTPDVDVENEPIEIWPYLAMVLLALLIIEWGVYYRDEF